MAAFFRKCINFKKPQLEMKIYIFCYYKARTHNKVLHSSVYCKIFLVHEDLLFFIDTYDVILITECERIADYSVATGKI